MLLIVSMTVAAKIRTWTMDNLAFHPADNFVSTQVRDSPEECSTPQGDVFVEDSALPFSSIRAFTPVFDGVMGERAQ
jgi:hypothetical protein